MVGVKHCRLTLTHHHPPLNLVPSKLGPWTTTVISYDELWLIFLDLSSAFQSKVWTKNPDHPASTHVRMFCPNGGFIGGKAARLHCRAIFYSARHFLPGCLCWSSLLTKQLCCNPPPFKSLPWPQTKALPSVFTLQIILRENKEQEGRIKENIIKGCL